jgi:hypothetical protein
MNFYQITYFECKKPIKSYCNLTIEIIFFVFRFLGYRITIIKKKKIKKKNSN